MTAICQWTPELFLFNTGAVITDPEDYRTTMAADKHSKDMANLLATGKFSKQEGGFYNRRVRLYRTFVILLGGALLLITIIGLLR